MQLIPRRSFLSLAALALACRRRASPRRLRGGAVAAAARIVSLSPVATEALFALGGGRRVVGISALCDGPRQALALPRVGTMAGPDAEAIRTLRPDAVVGVEGPLATPALRSLHDAGVAMVFPKADTLPDLRDALDVFAALVGAPDAADALRHRMDDDLARVRRTLQGRPRPRVLAVHNQNPLVVAGRGSWTESVLLAAGADNAAQSPNRHPMLSVEQVQSFAPEVLLDLTWHEGAAPLAEAWASRTDLTAITSGRVVRMTDVAVVRPGPRFAEAVVAVARALHPGVAL